MHVKRPPTALLRLAIGALCALSSAAAGSAQTVATIHVGMIPIEPAALVYFAKDMGFFQKAGLDVDIQQNPSTPALASALAAGTIDISYATIPTLAVAHVKHLPFVIIAGGISDSPKHFGGAIMVAENSTIRTGKDFDGKTLGAAGLNTIAEYLPRAWIDQNGGDSSTVKFIEIPFPETAAAIASGRIAGAYLAEPFVTIAERKHEAKILATGDSAIAPEFLATAWFTTAGWAKAHPDLVARFQRAMREAAAWANANPAKCVPILVRELHVNPTLTAAARRPFFDVRLTPVLIQPYIDVTAKYAKFPPFPAQELLPGSAR